ncbi:FAD-dependent monooxygenase [Chitiniphilus purpureus]|uniref:FAD-dependent monooxygenase n=1 Tax=Chitiniphilus purpureus TaxID=2981137 RepID=A0ABY6DL73_9NEIS|nr:FAD-dependent monooxygenase [Chitiniphilus sp. CD1]UXY15094.1 FAD-dependent monooxygenase [Chitiniphilus sp. CD1]
MHAPPLADHIDIAIVGGGPVGALLAARLARTGHRALLLEARTGVEADPRALALSHASREALESLGLWDDAALQATAIEQVHVSQAGSLGRVRLCASELGLPALGYVVGYAALAGTAQQRLQARGCAVALGCRVEAIRRLTRFAELRLTTPTGPHTLTCRLVVLADGGGLVEQLDDVARQVKPYAQHAVLATLTPNTSHHGIAHERFADDGPLALLPRGRDFNLVWTQTPEAAEARLALSDQDFLAEIGARLGGRVAGFSAVGPRASFALALKTLDRVVARRVALIGNAAQTLHPVAGQGLNLGLRDAATLADVLCAVGPAHLGEPETLARYARLRRKDAGLVTAFTDSLITLFDSPAPWLKHGRSLGLLALDQIAPLRRGFAARMVYGAR